jgi:hypothetical protein
VKFTPEGWRIAVRAGVVNGEVILSVMDTGLGIAPEHHEVLLWSPGPAQLLGACDRKDAHRLSALVTHRAVRALDDDRAADDFEHGVSRRLAEAGSARDALDAHRALEDQGGDECAVAKHGRLPKVWSGCRPMRPFAETTARECVG